MSELYNSNGELIANAELYDSNGNKLDVGGGDAIDAYFLKGANPKLPRTRKLCVLAAGQSNIDGRNAWNGVPSYVHLPMPQIRYCKNDATGTFVDYPNGGTWGFDLITYWYLVQDFSEIYVIKQSLGGTSIDKTGDNTKHWTADYEELDNLSNSLLLAFDKQIQKCKELHGEEFEIGAMLWHQGEGDRASYSQTAAANYYDNMKKVITYCRGAASNSNLPFVFGTISHNSHQYDATIDAAIRKIADEDANVYLVDMKNAKLRDEYHFNGAWSEYFGQKAYDCLVDAGVATGHKLNPVEPT